MRQLVGVRALYLDRPLQQVLAQSRGTIHADQVHAGGITGSGIGIAVLDSGVDGTHADLTYPAKTVQNVAPWVIGVAAGCKIGADPTHSVTECNDGRAGLLADFSSRGVPGHALYHPTLTAPGVYIVSARSKTGTVMNALDLQADATTCAIPAGDVLGYTCASGTSMAAPHIAGVVALMLEQNPSLTPSQIKSLLRSTTRPMPGYGEWEVGAGYVDAAAAVATAD